MALLNTYGDEYVPTSGTHGADIASQRCDELDMEAISFAKQIPNAFILDVGCGYGAQSVRFAAQGAKVVAIDIVNTVEHIHQSLRELSLSFDFVDFENSDIESYLERCSTRFDIIYSQRFIHYLHPLRAKSVVKKFFEILNSGGAVFVSASGIGSELSNNYSSVKKDISERFGFLSEQMQEKHGIKEPVCLYSPDELRDLFLEAGFQLKHIWESNFGNVKAVFVKT